MEKRKKDTKRALIVQELASKHRVTTGYVYKVLKGTRESERILSDFIDAYPKLLEAVKKAVPFD